MNWQTGKARCRSDEYEAEIGIVDFDDGRFTPIDTAVQEGK